MAFTIDFVKSAYRLKLQKEIVHDDLVHVTDKFFSTVLYEQISIFYSTYVQGR